MTAALALTYACADSTSPPVAERLALDMPATVVDLGDTLLMEARAYGADSIGVPVPVTWSTSDTTLLRVVEVTTDSTGLISRATLVAGGALGAVTVRAQAGVPVESAEVYVLALTELPPGFTALTGTPTADTLAGAAFTAPDTLVLTAPPLMEFTANTSVRLKGRVAVFRRTMTTLAVATSSPFAGRPQISNARYVLPSGPYWVDLQADSVRMARARFRGTITAESTDVGPRTLLRVSVPAPVTWFTDAAARFGPRSYPLTLAGGQATARPDSNFASGLALWGMHINGVRIDSLTPPANVPVSAPTLALPVSVGAGRLMDTLRVYAIPGVQFGRPPFTHPVPVLDVGGQDAVAPLVSYDSILGVAPRAGAWRASVRNVQVNGFMYARVFVPAPVVLDTAVSGEPDEPANDVLSGATALPFPADRIGAVSMPRDRDDWFTFTLAAPAAVTLTLAYGGDRRGTAGNPHLDLSLYRQPCGPTDIRRSTAESYGDVITDNLPAGTWCARVNAGPGADRLHAYALQLR